MIIKLDEGNTFAKEILSKISVKSDGAYIVFLKGELGSGKTTTTKSIAHELGIEEDITSPTFVILKRYEIKNSEFKNLIHVDAYRLKSFSELQKIKFEEYMKNAENLILLEWPEMVESDLLHADMTLTFLYGEGDDERIVEIQ